MPRPKHKRLSGRRRGQKAQNQPAVTEETLMRRRSMMAFQPGTPDVEKDRLALTQQAGIPIEILLSRRTINAGQAQAGREYRHAIHRWRRLHAIPDQNRAPSGIPSGTDPSPEEVERVDADVRRCRDALQQVHPKALVAAVIDAIVVEESLPPMFTQRAGSVQALRDGLDALRMVFKVPETEEDAA